MLSSYTSSSQGVAICFKNTFEFEIVNESHRYIDNVLSINNSRFAEFLPLIYHPALEVKETTDTASSHHFWTYTSNLTTVVKSVLKVMINGTTSILRS
jgi:hypothetical protein